MNPLNRYHRRTDRALPAVTAALTAAGPPPPPEAPAGLRRAGHRMAWTRLSDLPTVAGVPVMRRGIDLQAALARRARRAPAAAARAVVRGHRATTPSAAAPEPVARPGLGEVER